MNNGENWIVFGRFVSKFFFFKRKFKIVHIVNTNSSLQKVDIENLRKELIGKFPNLKKDLLVSESIRLNTDEYNVFMDMINLI